MTFGKLILNLGNLQCFSGEVLERNLKVSENWGLGGGAPVPYAYDGKTKNGQADRQTDDGRISQMEQAESLRRRMDIGAGEDR